MEQNYNPIRNENPPKKAPQHYQHTAVPQAVNCLCILKTNGKTVHKIKKSRKHVQKCLPQNVETFWVSRFEVHTKEQGDMVAVREIGTT